MRIRIFKRPFLSGRSMSEQTDAQNYHTFIEEYTKSGRLPSVTGLPLGSFDHDNDDFEIDVNDEHQFQNDRVDRFVKYRQQAIERQRALETPPSPPVPEDPTPSSAPEG